MPTPPIIPSVQAYTGVGQPNKVYSNSNHYDIVCATDPSVTNETKSISITPTEYGLIQGFLCSINITSASLTTGSWAGTFTSRIKRNGNTLHSQTNDIIPMLYGGPPYPMGSGVLFFENLNILSGAEIYPNEVFTLEFELVDCKGFAINIDMNLSLLMAVKPRQFSI